MVFNTYYKIGFVSDDFAQLLASKNVPSTFKVDQAKLWWLVGQVY